MPHTIEELLKLAATYEKLTSQFVENLDVGDLTTKTAKKEERKLDPKAEVRNRGTVCVPASSAKDKKDHFPINSENQARNALSRVHQYSKAPEWYSGSLKGLQDLVSRKVHSKYPSIGKEKKKKSSSEVVNGFIAKYSQTNKLDQAIADYDTGALLVQHLAEAMKRSAEAFAGENSLDEANNRKTYDTLLKQAELVYNLMPEMEALDKEMWDWSSPQEAIGEPTEPTKVRGDKAPVGYAKERVDLGGGLSMTRQEMVGHPGTDQEVWDILKGYNGDQIRNWTKLKLEP